MVLRQFILFCAIHIMCSLRSLSALSHSTRPNEHLLTRIISSNLELIWHDLSIHSFIIVLCVCVYFHKFRTLKVAFPKWPYCTMLIFNKKLRIKNKWLYMNTYIMLVWWITYTRSMLGILGCKLYRNISHWISSALLVNMNSHRRSLI